ncbi:MAG TPA: MoxR family ATPase [Thermoanaerobaculia bacterium]|jgi:MoxR-like ATPase|nr:MoxR family ATPase [Thermoanaerobaculia bacterium]HSK81668.1 MoxR family ATPase [Thermoanaerobaculia bacterium]
MSIDKVRELSRVLRDRIGRVIIGQEEAVHLLLVALISEGHVLFEGPPGTGKTLLARSFSSCLKLEFKRVQFTPDLMPGDLLGTNLFNFQTNTFTLTKGPLFTEFLLADEINRTPPKTQAALLEAMQERTVTIDGTSHTLSAGFMVVATQNPIEQEGTYPLPEAQLDRFLFKALIGYPGRDEEVTMVKTHGHQTAMPSLDKMGVNAVCDLRFIVWVRQVVSALRLSDEIAAYIVDLVRGTRNHPALQYGGSPRAANMLAAASRAAAVLEGREFVIPDDVKFLWKPLMRHRVVLAPSAEVDGISVDQALDQVLAQIPAPR